MDTTATAWPWAADMPEAVVAPSIREGRLLSKFGSGRTPDGTRLIRAFGLSRLEVAQLAAMDLPNLDLPFRRVSIDPVRGVAVMMAPLVILPWGGPVASRGSKVFPGAQPVDIKDGLRMLQDTSTPVIEGPRRIADAFAQRLARRMARGGQ